ncbi:COG1361 S-layer family protein [Natrinema salaciae]|uniref:Uncharacterized protein n=1 Tax=Natrinema salaciae TaxID=1186196 RepID=A0A1H9SQY9_9EURY|nr:hypothetical protein [Natrinema salaciae]SER87294.1 hypothetical protein SAMN04489841_4772 [Natrinema salaciae]
MSGRAAIPSRRRRVVVTVSALSLVVVIGVVTATVPIETQTVTPLQNESGNDTSAAEPSDGPVTDESAPAARAAGNESAPRPPVENDTPASGPPRAASATDPPLVQALEGNVTVAVAANQSVRAGETTSITLEVTNDGDRQATDVVVTVRAADGAVTLGPPAAPQSIRSVVVDDIWPGDTETVAVDVVASDVDSGRYPLFASVQYKIDTDAPVDAFQPNETDETNDTRTDDDDDDDTIVRTEGPTLLELAVDRSRAFDVTPVNDEIPVDGEGVYEARIRNDGDEPVTGVVATVEVGPPLTSESPTAHLGTLDAGESKTARFALESSPDAVETTTSVALTLEYETDAGARTSADPVPLPVSIVERDDDTDVDSVAPFVAVALVFVLAAVWWARRR